MGWSYWEAFVVVFHKLCRASVENGSSGLCGTGAPSAFVDKGETDDISNSSAVTLRSSHCL